MIVTNVGGVAVDAIAAARHRRRRAGLACERSAGAQTNGAFAYGEGVWSWHPLLVSSRRRLCEPNRVRRGLQSADDGDKTNSSPGRARE